MNRCAALVLAVASLPVLVGPAPSAAAWDRAARAGSTPGRPRPVLSSKSARQKFVATSAVKGPVLEVGDSLGIDLGWGLQQDLASSGHEFFGEAVGDTGLSEPWYYNWPAHLARFLAEYHPGLLVVFLGANDAQNLDVGGQFEPFGSRGWAAVYGQRVATMMQEAVGSGAKVVWVGMPPMADPHLSSDMEDLDAVYEQLAAEHQPDVTYFSSWFVLGTAHGQYQQGPPGAEQVQWRASDGVHITPAGADVLAKALVEYLRAKGWLQG